jgi:hypothetical protein
MITGMETIYDVLRALVNAARITLNDSVIADLLTLIDTLEAGPVPADAGGKKNA